ncbi:protealysin inhibitor emfourin [Euzebyella saccharophila]|uniref:Protealysin inhibitor emfourin n=1 Tax=Euzebyella saccharophila TaxID=679664 RepID=A0ABV8JPH9_9FLAO|nr:protealysin inhibitor emfourin [Euzebyella saccharophila]
MRYRIEISGGFSGIPKTYEGRANIEKEQLEKIIHYLEENTNESNPDLRDGQQYSFQIEEGTQSHSALFTEKSLPTELRQLLEQLAHPN